MAKNQFLFFVLLLLATSFSVRAQQGFTDDFSDGNFTANPSWLGETAKFQVDVNNQLQLNDGTANSPAYLVTVSPVINDASWEFYVEMDFAPSGSNYGEVFLVSSQQDLSQSLDGYFVRIGGISGSADDVSLYRMDGTSAVEIIDGIDGIVGQDPVKVKVRVTKDLNGQWELFADTSAALNNPVSQGTVTDQTHVQSNYFGVLCTYTSTRSDRFFFDDFVVNGQAFQDTVKPEIDTFMVNGNTQIELHFSEFVDVSTASNPGNYDLDPALGNPTSVVIDANDSSRLTLDYPSGFVSGTNYELEVQNVEDRNGNAIDTDTLDFFYFDPAPSIDSVVVQGNNQLEVYFSELVEVQTATSATNFTANNSLGNPSNATIDAIDSSLVKLDFATNFVSGTNYDLEVKNIADRNGNVMTTDTVSFFYFVPATAAYRDVVINEFYPDPTPSNGLPSGEFVEIYNASNKVFDIQNWEISDATSSENLPSYILPSDEYVIICAQSDVAAYQGFGNVIGISSLPTLNNGGDEVMLKDNNGTTIDQLEYDLSWYKDASKESGGWTLEQINPFTDCIGINNYSASTANFGGTPGIENSVYDTLPDITAPTISKVMVLSRDSVRVSFSEYMDSTSIENGTYTFNTSAAVGQVFNQPPAYTSALLLLSTPLDSGILHTFSVSGVSDCAGNLINSNNQNDLVIPAIPKYRDVVINELLPDYSPSVGLPQAEFIELFNASDKIFDLAGWNLADPSSDVDLNSQIFQPGDFVIVCAQSSQSAFQAFGNTMGLSSLPSLNNSDDQIRLFDPNGNLVDMVNYTTEWYQDFTKDDGGWSLEQINPFTNCTGKSNFIASNANQGGTPGTQNSVFDTLPDTGSPILETADVLSADSILLAFNERLDSVSVLNANYSFNTGVTVGSVQNIYPDYDQVLLILSNPLDSGVINTITVTNITDCPGNQIGSQNQVDIVVPGIPDYRDVVINEFLCDPSPEVGLPEAEFIELFNASSKIFDLSGWTVGDQSTLSTLKNLIFEPGDYIIICDQGNEAALQSFGPTQGQSSFATLGNSQDDIILRDPRGKVIDQISYTDKWYRDDTKSSGGYSIEQINPDLECNGAYNFRASVSSTGGTPGQVNSVLDKSADDQGPILQNVLVYSGDTLTLEFSEGVDSVTAITANYIFSNGASIDTVLFDYLNLSRITLVLDQRLDSGKVITLEVQNLFDCSANHVVAPATIKLALPQSANAGDLVINEILFNPRGDAEDFVELYNRSEKIISLQNWKLAYKDGSAKNQDLITTKPYLVFPGDYVGITKNLSSLAREYPNTVRSNFIEEDKIPNFRNDADTVYVFGNDGKQIDRVTYDEDQHFELLNDVDGVSLERIDPDRASDDSDNFHSAAESEGFATPGYENSQYFANTRFSGKVTIDPETISPDNDGYQDVVNINYEFGAPGYVASVDIYDRSGRLIKSLIDNELLGSKGSFSWDGITDENTKARVGIYIVFFEAFNPSGDKEVFKKTLVVAAYLD